jgi:succinyl-diaminopimelate desuccinylase
MNAPLDPVELTRTLIAFNTINPPGNERPCAEHLGKLLENAGFSVAYHEFADRRTSLVARIGGTDEVPPLCFTGHIDTVPLGAASWSVDPFAGEISDGKLYGRGSTDMKSGVAAFVVACLEMKDELSQGPGVVLVITAGEETGCEGSYDMAKRGDILGDAGAIVVAEPTHNQPLLGHKGAIWLTARTTGVTAHGSMPEKGDNAIYKAARAITKLEDFDFNIARDPVLGKPTLNVGVVNGGLNVNSVPDATEVGVDVRTTVGMDHGKIHNDLSGYLGEEVSLKSFVNVGGVLTDVRNEWIQDVFDVMTDILGERPEANTAPYFTDASALTPAYGGAPTVILGPGETAMAHQTDEYCLVERINQAVEAYKEIARRWSARS